MPQCISCSTDPGSSGRYLPCCLIGQVEARARPLAESLLQGQRRRLRALGNHSTLKAPEKSRSANGQKRENPIWPQPDSTLLSYPSLIRHSNSDFSFRQIRAGLTVTLCVTHSKPQKTAKFFPRRTLVGGLHEKCFGETITTTAQGNSTSTMAKASKIHCIEK
jgi:hypothetical protein